MKTYININRAACFIIAAIIGLLMAGCEDFLTEEPKTFIDPGSFYNNQEDIKAGLTGVYASWPTNHYWINFHERRAEYYIPKRWTGDLVGWINMYSAERHLPFIWHDPYLAINQANNFIDLLEPRDVKFSVTLKNRYLAEAKFIRAYMYYNLVQYFGDVPFTTTPSKGGDDFFIPRTPAADVWDFIESELRTCIADLPEKSEYSGEDISRVNKSAAKMLLAKSYMVLQNWSEAKILVDEIIALGEFVLEPDITDNWDIANEHGIESILEKEFGRDFTPNRASTFCNMTLPKGWTNPVTGQSVSGCWVSFIMTPFFYWSFEDTDVRKTDLIITDSTEYNSAYSKKGERYTTKYFAPEEMGGSANQSPVNWVVFRYADLLLMKAEIENELNSGPSAEAYEAIDAVRARANVSVLPRGLSYEEFVDAIFDERAKELFFEGHRFFDLKRRGFNFLEERIESSRQQIFDYYEIDDVQYDVEEYMMLMPIPQTDLDANPNLTQNPGYE